ncbi:short-chain dehydrogenase/reductase family 42E member 1-like [Narcine bancroftii]|uniref:short-chain dehydrogenase/reductase family 42E member 1-like n=1 Tax=Narcine bancroftii TaxID=1343680 RepID=UPI0038317E1C
MRQELPAAIIFVREDVCNYLEVEAAFRNVDCVFHLASYDHYSRTKSVAEMKVLYANTSKLRKGSGVLQTCALRPAGIYGPVKTFQMILHSKMQKRWKEIKKQAT